MSNNVFSVWWDRHYTQWFNVLQTLYVAVSRCTVIPEWPCSMLGHEGPIPTTGRAYASASLLLLEILFVFERDFKNQVYVLVKEHISFMPWWKKQNKKKHEIIFYVNSPPSIMTMTLNICSCMVVAAILPKPTLVSEETMKYNEAMYLSSKPNLTRGSAVLFIFVVLYSLAFVLLFMVLFARVSTILLHKQTTGFATVGGGCRSSFSRRTQLSGKCSSVVEMKFHKHANQCANKMKKHMSRKSTATPYSE